MTEFERIERKIKALQIQLIKVQEEGTGNIEYVEKGYFSKNCRVFLKGHVYGKPGKERNFGPLWDGFVKAAKSLYSVSKEGQLTPKEADVCVAYLEECVGLYNKYSAIVKDIENRQNTIEKDGK